MLSERQIRAPGFRYGISPGQPPLIKFSVFDPVQLRLNKQSRQTKNIGVCMLRLKRGT